MKDNINIKESSGVQIYPCVPTRELVVFPNMVMHFDVGRAGSVKAMKNALQSGGYVYLVAQKDVNVERPEKNDVYKIGTVAKVKQLSLIHI